jgi:tetratricopeptide (TPR) repeat protein
MNVIFVVSLLAFSASSDAWVNEERALAEAELKSGDHATVEQAKARFTAIGEFAAKENDVDWTVYAAWKQACCDYRLGRYSAAEETLSEVIRLHPGHGLLLLLHRDLGEFYLDSDKIESAREHLQKALKLAPNFNFRGQALSLPPLQVTRIRLLKARYLAQALENQNARDELLAIQKTLAALPFAGSKRKNEDEEKSCQLVDSDMILAELDRRDSNSLAAIARLKSCVERLEPFNSEQSALRQFSCHIQAVTDLSRLTRFADGEAEVAAAEVCLRNYPSERRRKELSDARLLLQIESIRCAVEDNARDAHLLERLEAAERLASRGLAEKGGSNPRNPLPAHFAANDHNSLAHVYALRGRVLEAMEKRDEALNAYQNAKAQADDAVTLFKTALARDHDILFDARRHRAELNMKLGDLRGAREEATDVLNLLVKSYGPQHVDCALCHQLLIEIESRAGNNQAAALHAEANRRLANERFQAFVTGLTLVEQQTFFRRWDDPGFQSCLRLGVSDKSLWEASAEWLLNGKAKTSEVLAQVNRKGSRSSEFRMFRRAVESQAYILYGPAGTDQEARLSREERVKRDLAGRGSPIASARWHSLQQLRRLLKADEVYVDIVCLNDPSGSSRTYYAWVLPAGEPERVVKLGRAEQIEELVQGLIDRLQIFKLDGSVEAKAGLAAGEKELRGRYLEPLSELILAPVRAAAAGKKRWIISPDGALWNVSWAALLLRETKDYAVKEMAFRYVISGRDLSFRQPVSTIWGPPLVVADPDYDLAQPGVQGRWRGTRDVLQPAYTLPDARREGLEVVECLKRLQWGPDLKIREQATKDLIADTKLPPRLLYLSSHSFCIPRGQTPIADPFLSCGVALAGFNFLPDDKALEAARLTGMLTGAEVLLANLEGTELVVLSACQTGTGITAYGHGAASLRHAFHLAGARAVVSTLWSVEDAATKDLVVSFLNEPSLSSDKADALRKAQLKVMDQLSRGGHHTHPFLWAAFTVSGF